MRHIILHRHIFKNAGSSIDNALRNHFGERFSEFHAVESDNGRMTLAALVAQIESNPDLACVSSHHFGGRDFAAELSMLHKESFRFVEFTLIRHPVARLLSIYSYYRGIEMTDHPLSICAHHLDAREFAFSIVERYPNFAINPQTTLFGCKKGYGAPPTEAHLEIAIASLKESCVIGTVEKFDESMVCAEYFLSPMFPGVELHTPVVNQSVKPHHEAKSGGSAQALLGADLLEQLTRMNALDIRLWNAMNEEVQRRAEYVEGFSRRLDDYRERCRSSTSPL
jgi:hypothetical protein